MAVGQALAAADEDFPEGPVLLFHVVGFRPQPCWTAAFRLSAFLGVSSGRFAHPCAVIPCLAPGVQAFFVAGAVSGNHTVEFIPIDGADARNVPFPRSISGRHREWSSQ